jgi:CRP-like cAMP-binding protein
MTAHALAAAFPLLTPAQLDQISGIAENVAIEKGIVLLREGEQAQTLYLITDGIADLIKHLAEAEIVVAELKAGELLGEMSLAGNFPATATVKAATHVAALKIDKSRLMTLLESDTALGFAVFRCIASTLARRLLLITERFAFLRA